MPDRWFERMRTIKTYEQDHSAMSRINSWHFAINLANAHPVLGRGYGAFTPELFAEFAPDHTERAEALTGLAAVELAEGDAAAALRRLDEAQPLWERTHPRRARFATELRREAEAALK